ncbi:MAG: AAA family ATPase [Candidatus Paceibacterota bacterium]|jgi:chromosome segregation ATPase
MIQSIEISNFQSHKQTELIFDPGLNIIVGSSDAGKSAVLRALRWVIWNRPSGDSLRSYWGGKTSVKATFNNGSIERSKDKAEEYIINDKTSLKAFGLSIPDEVSALHNLTEINVQGQMDSSYLLSSTPGEIAAHFNKVAGLDKIDRAQQNVEKEIRSLTSDIKYKTAEQEKLNTQLESFEYLEKYEIKLEILEEMETRKNNLSSRTAKFIKHFNSLVDLENEIEEASEILKHEEQVNLILVSIETRNFAIAEKDKLETLIGTYDLIEDAKRRQGYTLALEIPVNSLLGKIEDRKKLNTPFVTLNKLVKSLKGISITLEEDNRMLSLQMAKFKKEMPTVCPLCDTILTNKKHNHENR